MFLHVDIESDYQNLISSLNRMKPYKYEKDSGAWSSQTLEGEQVTTVADRFTFLRPDSIPCIVSVVNSLVDSTRNFSGVSYDLLFPEKTLLDRHVKILYSRIVQLFPEHERMVLDAAEAETIHFVYHGAQTTYLASVVAAKNDALPAKSRYFLHVSLSRLGK